MGAMVVGWIMVARHTWVVAVAVVAPGGASCYRSPLFKAAAFLSSR